MAARQRSRDRPAPRAALRAHGATRVPPRTGSRWSWAAARASATPATAARPGASSAACDSRSTRRAKTRRGASRTAIATACPTRGTPVRDLPGLPELDGCPDRDGDEIPDREDRCPTEPGPAAREGCPVAEDEPLVDIETERLSLKDAIQFDTGRDTLRSKSFPVLDAISGILAAHPELRRVRVEGHTDDVGSNAYNKDLSNRRAHRRALPREQGASPSSGSIPTGFGEDRPVASNATALGRAKNRRVEFTLIDEAKAAP